MSFGRDLPSFPVFPTFLIPSPPFPKRHQQQHILQGDYDQVAAAAATASSEAKALRLSHSSYIRCARCGSDICHTSQIISKGFTGRHGRAFLVSPTDSTIGRHQRKQTSTTNNTLPNTITQKAVPRQLVTGAHTVADINCVLCGSVLGWKYIAAEEEAQRYKVGKYILETKRITTSACWEFEDDFSPSSPLSDDSRFSAAAGSANDDNNNNDTDSSLEFDSQDEDECEDLFTGVWSASLARRRRSRKVNRK
jgi:Yippee zinc-binding/DNA-binding /Mis18, centromere assembly